jgi:hypothetical protein
MDIIKSVMLYNCNEMMKKADEQELNGDHIGCICTKIKILIFILPSII